MRKCPAFHPGLIYMEKGKHRTHLNLVHKLDPCQTNVKGQTRVFLRHFYPQIVNVMDMAQSAPSVQKWISFFSVAFIDPFSCIFTLMDTGVGWRQMDLLS